MLMSFWNTLKYCGKIVWNASKVFTIIRIGIQFVTPIFGLVNAYIFQLILQQFEEKNGSILAIEKLILLYGIVSVITLVASQISNYVQNLQDALVEKEIQLNLMKIANQSDLELFDRPEYYNQYTKSVRDSFSINQIVWQSILCMGFTISFIGSFVIASKKYFFIAAIVVVSTIPSVLIKKLFSRKSYALSVQQIDEKRKQNYTFSASIEKEFSMLNRLYDLSNFLTQKYSCHWNKLFGEKKRLLKKQTISFSILSSFPEIVNISVLLYLARNVFLKYIMVSDYVFLIQIISTLKNSTSSLITGISAVYENRLQISGFNEINEFSENKIKDGTVDLKDINSISFENVYFHYPSNERMILKNLNFSISKGEKIGLVGMNGSGKSTLIKLLLRFYEPTSGRILINGSDYSKYTIKSLRNQFGCYFQNQDNYCFDLFESIAFDTQRNDQSKKDVINSLNDAEAEGILKKIDNNLETYIGRAFSDHGEEFSGGENQKISLGRTFYWKRKLLILDEPTSSLDPKAEEKLLKTICEKYSEGGVIFISHKLTNLYLANKILLLDNGEIIESGSLDEMISRKGEFYNLYKYQIQKC